MAFNLAGKGRRPQGDAAPVERPNTCAQIQADALLGGGPAGPGHEWMS